jgi:hypothetical protein
MNGQELIVRAPAVRSYASIAIHNVDEESTFDPQTRVNPAQLIFLTLKPTRLARSMKW